MKKNIKKILSAVLALVAVLSLSIPCFAADISSEQAKQIALGDAGYSTEQVVYIRADYEFDDGRKVWNVDFLVEDDKGRRLDYDYEIAADNGRILEKDYDLEDDFYHDTDDKLENYFEALFRKFINWLKSLFTK